MSDARIIALENVACPARRLRRPYTANTMSTVMEMIGLSPMGFNSFPMDLKRIKSPTTAARGDGPAEPGCQTRTF